MQPASTNQVSVQGLRINPQEQERIVQELQQAGLKVPAEIKNRRQHPRLPMPPTLVVKFEVSQPGGTVQRFIVRGRNISNSGMSVLHGGFLHARTNCHIEIYNGQTPLVRIPAEVMHCRYVRSTAHEIGLRFGQLIDAEAILNCDDPPAQPAGPGSTIEDAAPPPLAGHVLHIDPNELDRSFVNARMTQMGLTFTSAGSSMEAVELASERQFDLVLCGNEITPDPPLYVVRRIRKGGLMMPILVMGQTIPKAQASELIDAGVHACISKPLNPEEFSKLLRKLLPEAKKSTKPHPQLSQHWDELPLRPLIIDYLNDLPKSIDTLQKTLKDLAADQGTVHAQRFASTASLHGFAKISEIATELATILTLQPPPAEMIRDQIAELHEVVEGCRAALQ